MGALVNAARGEVAVMINGVERRLCLTLGALASLETHFAASGPSALGERLRTLSASDIVVVLHALLRGGGEDLSVDDLRAATLSPSAAADAVARAFAAALS